MRPPVCCVRRPASTVWTTRPHASRCEHAFREPTMTISCCWMTCSASAIPRSRCLRSIPTPVADDLPLMVKAAALARTTPTVYVIEDAHWIDGISESMLAEFLTVIPQTRSFVAGHLPAGIRWRTCACAAVADDCTRAAGRIADAGVGCRTSGRGQVGHRTCRVDRRARGGQSFLRRGDRPGPERARRAWSAAAAATCASIGSPMSMCRSTLQAVIAARIDRLDPAAKRTLNAAAVIGSRFTPDMLEALGIEAALGDLVSAELIDQAAFHPQPEYVFRHPLVRAVAYESQLKSDRAQLHKRVAAAIEQDDQNAALIAEHLEAAGDLAAAYEWHMRAGGWSIQSRHRCGAAQLGARARGGRCAARRRRESNGEAHRPADADMREQLEAVPPGHLIPLLGAAGLVHPGRGQGVTGGGDGRNDGRVRIARARTGCLTARFGIHGFSGIDRRPGVDDRAVVCGCRGQA